MEKSTTSEQLAAILRHGNVIQYVKSPSSEVDAAHAVSEEKTQLDAVRQSESAIQYVVNSPPETD